MAIEKMSLVSITGDMEELDDALQKCCDSGFFHIEPAFSGGEGRGHLLNEKNEYEAILKRLSQFVTYVGLTPVETDHSSLSAKSPDELSAMCDELENELAALKDKKQEDDQRISELSAAQIQIEHLKGMNSDFQQLFSCKYVSVRIGRLPIDNYSKLEYYNENFFFVPFETSENFCWEMYFCPESEKELIDDLFRSMYFERIMLPRYVSGNADEALARINDELKELKASSAETDKKISDFRNSREKELQVLFSKVRFLSDSFELRRNVGAINGRIGNRAFMIKGFIPKKREDKFSELFKQLETTTVTYMPADADASCTPPTMLKNNFLTRPFTMMVEMYGLPEYDGINPTAFVALTYTLLFGIMFGDLGQGLVLFLGSILLNKKLGAKAAGMVRRVGLSSMVFGTLYGSFFGYEELLDPVFENLGIDFLPLKVFRQTNFILITAVGIGIALIVISMLLNIYAGFKKKDYEKAIFGCNGICGLIFYSSVIVGVVGSIMFDMKIMSTPFVICLIVIPLICIFCRVPFAAAVKYKKLQLSEDGEKMTIGNFIVENFFEMFEFVLSYVSNTMSFLRVGGFVLSHAGMMLVVMTLMDGASAVAQPIVLVIGNLFVMAMEGMIVAIQIIRLEFYEMFSRFYDGGGKPFEPISLKFSAQVEQ
ncbi:MAG: ATPase [Ruminococcus sp.]|nr:ATPase [Ruminococcus sp.]